MNEELASAILASAQRLGANPLDLATAISYETSGTFAPDIKGPVTPQWGQHQGLIQWGERGAGKDYGYRPGMPVTEQMGLVEKYLVDRGFKAGGSMLDLYSTINAGRPGRYNASDANNGGAPGTVRDKVLGQMGDHRLKAQRLLGILDDPARAGVATARAMAPVATPMGAAMGDPTAPVALDPSMIAALRAIAARGQQDDGEEEMAPIRFATPPGISRGRAQIRQRRG